MIDQAFAEASRNDLKTLFPAAFIVMITLTGSLCGLFMGRLPRSS